MYLDSKLVTKILLEFTNIPTMLQEDLEKLESDVYKEISSIKPLAPKPDGVGLVCDILQKMKDTDIGRQVLQEIDKKDRKLYWKVRTTFFQFEDIINIDDRAMQKLLRELKNFELAYALKGQPDNIIEKVLKNMSKRSAIILKEDMEYMGPVRLQDCMDARKKIRNILLKLSEAGEIILAY